MAPATRTQGGVVSSAGADVSGGDVGGGEGRSDVDGGVGSGVGAGVTALGGASPEGGTLRQSAARRTCPRRCRCVRGRGLGGAVASVEAAGPGAEVSRLGGAVVATVVVDVVIGVEVLLSDTLPTEGREPPDRIRAVAPRVAPITTASTNPGHRPPPRPSTVVALPRSVPPDDCTTLVSTFRTVPPGTERGHRTSPDGVNLHAHIGSDDPPGAVLALVGNVSGPCSPGLTRISAGPVGALEVISRPGERGLCVARTGWANVTEEAPVKRARSLSCPPARRCVPSITELMEGVA